MTSPMSKIAQTIPALKQQEGAGVTIYRSIGTPALRHYDPFLLLDQFGSERPEDYIAGFPEHPHRGFITLTYMLDGHMQHRDSMGHTGELRAGGIQWMKAAGGVLHSEMPQQEQGLMRGFQLWLNLPATEKMRAPQYQEYSAAEIPVVDDENGCVKVISGRYQNATGPIEDKHTDLLYWDIQLRPGGVFHGALPTTHKFFAYLFEGAAELQGRALPLLSLALLTEGEALRVEALDEPARFLLVGGRPIGEPIVQYGPFVMNTREEVMQAMEDYRNGRLVQS